VGIKPRSTLGVRVGVEVGFKVVCRFLFVPYCSGSQVVECINMYEYHHLLS